MFRVASYAPQPHHPHRHSPLSSFSYDEYDSLRSRRELELLAVRQQERRVAEQEEILRRRQFEEEVQRRVAVELEVRRRVEVEERKRRLELEEQRRRAKVVELERRRRAQQEEQLRQQLFSHFLRLHSQPQQQRSAPPLAPAPAPVATPDPISFLFQFFDSPEPESAPTPAPQQPSPVDQAAAAATLQRHYRAHIHRRDQLSKLSSLTSSLESHTSSFVLPDSLTLSSEGKLAYSPTNAPVLAHEEFLVGLLSQVDEVQSGGDRVVKQARKELVRKVEEQLRKIDEKKESEVARFLAASEGKGKAKAADEDVDDTTSIPDLLPPSSPSNPTPLTAKSLADVPSRPSRRNSTASTASRTISTLGDVELDEAVAKVLAAAEELGKEVIASEETEAVQPAGDSQPVAAVEDPTPVAPASASADSATATAPSPADVAHTPLDAQPEGDDEEGYLVV